MTAANDVCLSSAQNCHTVDTKANLFYLEPNLWRTLSPEMKRGSLHLYPSRMSNASTKNINEEGDFLADDKSISNRRSTFSLFNSNLNGEKKFISELHINIKNEGDNQCDLRQSQDSQRNVKNCNIVHSSELKTYIGDHNEDYDLLTKNSEFHLLDHVSNSTEFPIKKKECHHSEKFIYLGGDLNHESQDYDLHSYHSDMESSEESKLHSTFKSDQSLINDDSKSFSSKAVQTSKTMDCIFKVTCERGVETDVQKAEFNTEKINKKKIKSKHLANRFDRTPSSTCSDNVCVECSDSIENNRKQKEYTEERKTERKRNVFSSKQTRGFIPSLNKQRNQPVYTETNQDTDIGSYSESFNKTNESFAIEEDVKPHKYLTKKYSTIRPDMVKPNNLNVNQKSNIKAQKRLSDQIIIKKANGALKKSIASDIKPKSNSKVENEKHSYEIQCLLDNLNIHLQNTVNSNKSKIVTPKSNNPQYNSTSSFWDNPLNPETNRSLFLNKQSIPKVRDMNRRKTVNPEIQAVFETLEKSQNQIEKGDFGNSRKKDSPQLEYNTRISKLSNTVSNDNHSIKRCCDGMGSIDSLNDFRFPSTLKFQKSFELSPYDELVKSHLNSSDRRIKSVAAKNGCQIVIDGPINLTDPTSTCQAIRTKVAYRCAVASSSKDKLDKCLNYLKETFPNTCLRMHSRNNISMKS